MTPSNWKLTRDADGEPQAEEWGGEGPRFGTNLMGAAEIQARLELTKGEFNGLGADESFPEPLSTLHSGRVWLTEDIEAWIATHRPDQASIPH
ncbi:hypothetical protein [Actinoplanes awajinensis]|uniref:hypothetical protein n=1 Tax=Actinoplanes awajinensis TaxID=135946 RepID=UPI000A9F3CB1|nr:hypothetical protein [Actinoplanes awajinensis]